MIATHVAICSDDSTAILLRNVPTICSDCSGPASYVLVRTEGKEGVCSGCAADLSWTIKAL